MKAREVRVLEAKRYQGGDVFKVDGFKSFAAGTATTAKNPGPPILLVIDWNAECLLWLTCLFNVLHQHQLDALDYSIRRYTGEKTYQILVEHNELVGISLLVAQGMHYFV